MELHTWIDFGLPGLALVLAVGLLFWAWRGKRILPLVVAAALLLFSAAWLAMGRRELPPGSQASSQPPQASPQPLALSNPSTQSSRVVLSQAEVEALIQQWEQGQLPAEQIPALVEGILALQANLELRWNPKWGQVIERLRQEDKLPEADWQRYWRQAWHFGFQVRPKVRRGDPLPVSFWFSGYRYADHPAVLNYELIRIQINGTDCAVPDWLGGRRVFDSRDWRRWMPVDSEDFVMYMARHPDAKVSTRRVLPDIIRLPSEFLAHMKEGRQEVRGIVELSVRDLAQGIQLPQTRIELVTHFELVPADAPVVKLITPAEHCQAMISSVSIDIEKATIQKDYLTKGTDLVTIVVSAEDPPVPIAAEVFLRSGEQEWPKKALREDYFRCTPGSTQIVIVQTLFRSLEADSVDVILRPSVDVAARTVDVTEIWGEEIVIKNIPLQRLPK